MIQYIQYVHSRQLQRRPVRPLQLQYSTVGPSLQPVHMPRLPVLCICCSRLLASELWQPRVLGGSLRPTQVEREVSARTSAAVSARAGALTLTLSLFPDRDAEERLVVGRRHVRYRQIKLRSTFSHRPRRRPDTRLTVQYSAQQIYR